jgi:hypothetical protein
MEIREFGHEGIIHYYERTAVESLRGPQGGHDKITQSGIVAHTTGLMEMPRWKTRVFSLQI